MLSTLNAPVATFTPSPNAPIQPNAAPPSDVAAFFIEDPANAAPQAALPAAQTSAQISAQASAQTSSQTPDDVFAKYDLHNISPRDVDKMASELSEAGFQDTGFLLTLLTQGEDFQRHLSSLNATEQAYAGPDPTVATDLIEQTKAQRTMSARAGAPTDFLDQFLEKLESYTRTASTAPQNGFAETAFAAALSDG